MGSLFLFVLFYLFFIGQVSVNYILETDLLKILQTFEEAHVLL